MSGWVAVGAVFAGVGVALGAFGAHGLRGRIAPELLEVFETGVRYQLYHALALLAVGRLAGDATSRWLRVAGWAFAAGIVVFSGSLYILSLTGVRIWGAVTPVGGVAFLVGWVCLVAAALRNR